MNARRHAKIRFGRGSDRQGATVVEFAICVPMLFVVSLGCIELTRYNLVKNVANQAAFEAARMGVKPGATAQEVIDEATYQMRYVCNNCSVFVTPTVITSSTDRITVVIQVDIRDQGWLTPQYFHDPILEAAITIRRDNVQTY